MLERPRRLSFTDGMKVAVIFVIRRVENIVKYFKVVNRNVMEPNEHL